MFLVIGNESSVRMRSSAFFQYVEIICFSEENVWMLCEKVSKENAEELSRCYAVFVSNEGRTVPLWRQKAGHGDDHIVMWVNIVLVPTNENIL